MSFSTEVIEWQERYGRHDLPWQRPLSAYRVWISEIMLQQTQVATVKGYFSRFIKAFPDVDTLAESPIDRVLAAWAGLGYYRRAQHLHKAAQMIVQHHDSEVPTDPEQLIKLPGIGKSTAHAIASIAGNKPFAILDANVKRVLARYWGIKEDLTKASVKSKLFERAQSLMPSDKCRIYTQGMMDLGAMICTKTPYCNLCPIKIECITHKNHWQTEIPLKVKKKKKPTRTHYYILSHNTSSILLYKRPEKGIWAQLWCLPEFQDYKALEQALPEDYQGKLTCLEEVKHTFTHFHLKMIPVLTQSQPLPLSWANSVHRIPLDKLEAYGLPAPIEKIIQTRVL